MFIKNDNVLINCSNITRVFLEGNKILIDTVDGKQLEIIYIDDSASDVFKKLEELLLYKA
jgi:hypothetical protein